MSVDQQEAFDAAVELLQEYGPALGRPTADTLKGSRHQNMKELRVSQDGQLRVLFAFDPQRTAILLLGGDKTGQWDEWYKVAIAQADDRYDEHLDTLRKEGAL